MMVRPLALFRASSNQKIGGGHVFRCLALAYELRSRGWSCHFVSGPETKTITPAVADFSVIEVPEDGVEPEIDLIQKRLTREPIDLFILDHYGRDDVFQGAARAWTNHILVIEDMPNRSHKADMLLDQSGGRSTSAYEKLVPETCRLLLGPRYALLRAQFRELPNQQLPIKNENPRIFISMGATDVDNLTRSAIKTVINQLPEAQMDVMLSSGAPHIASLKNEYAEEPRITIHEDVADPCVLMMHASFCIGTAGINLWERCALGIPSIIHVAAENQMSNALHVARNGGGQIIGEGNKLDKETLANALRTLRKDKGFFANMGKKAREICDGYGTERVANAIEDLCA